MTTTRADGSVPDRWHDIVHALNGSAATLQSILEEGEEGLELDSDFCAFLDSHIAVCEDCGWWCEVGELDDDGVCGDCHEEAEED